ncbi:MAG: bifunctional diguanylate cyclase/phosphodiesterase [Xanthobacteraceae bacterium]
MSSSDQLPSGHILASIAHVEYVWDIASGAMNWGEGIARLLPEFSPQTLASAGEFAKCIEPAQAVRSDVVLCTSARDAGEGVPFQLEYGVRTAASAPIVWIEEAGRWYAGPDGRPARAQGVIRAVNERHARDEQLLKASQQDPLTGELNRTRLMAALAEATEESQRFRTSFAFLVVSIDHLSHINDAFGFDIADEVIREVAMRLRARLRGGDVLGRFSGNKLGVILKNCAIDEMKIAAERFLVGVREDVVPTHLGPVSVTVSIGGINVPRYARTANDVVSRAQEALESAKSRRAGSFAGWLPNVEREAQRRVNIRVTDEIVSALNDRRLVIAFEPVVKADTQEAAFYECLVRMRHEDGLTLAPDIVPVAEKLGLIRLVDHRVLELVLEELNASPNVQLSLNISPDTTTDPDWWSIIEAALKANPAIAQRLIVEITETVAIRDIEDVRGFVTRLKNHGCRIAIDDFGAGYTSFRNLRKLGVDIVKIDGAFVQNVSQVADDRAFVQTLIDLARRLDLKTVAEWVQDAESAELLRAWGCDYIQGRFIGLASDERPWSRNDAARGELPQRTAR